MPADAIASLLTTFQKLTRQQAKRSTVGVPPPPDGDECKALLVKCRLPVSIVNSSWPLPRGFLYLHRPNTDGQANTCRKVRRINIKRLLLATLDQRRRVITSRLAELCRIR